MNCGHYVRCQGGGHELSAVPHDAEFPAEQSLCGRSSQAHDHVRVRDLNLGIQPWTARLDLRISWFFVNPAFAPLGRDPAKMFHRVRDVDVFAINACGVERLIENAARGSDEWMSGNILFILSPGCSPINIMDGRELPSPKTVWVAFFHRSQPLQLRAASRRRIIVGFLGRKGVASPCFFARSRGCIGISAEMSCAFRTLSSSRNCFGTNFRGVHLSLQVP
jgi:hypothetical protein